LLYHGAKGEKKKGKREQAYEMEKTRKKGKMDVPGINLLEVMIVLAILAIVAGIAYPPSRESQSIPT